MRLVDGPTSSTGSRRNHRWSERGASPSQPRDHLQIFGIPYLLEMMIGLAVDFSKHQWLSQRICGAHAAEHWCGNTDSGVTTGIEVSRIRRVRLSLRDGWSTVGTAKTSAVNRAARRDRRVDIEIGPPAHNILNTDSSVWLASFECRFRPETDWSLL